MTDLIVHEDWQTNSVTIYLKKRDGNNSSVIGYKDGCLIEQQLEQNCVQKEPLIPLLQMPKGYADIFFKAVADYFSSTGRRTSSEDNLMGKVSAMESHLSDTRKHLDMVLNKLLQ